MKIYVASSWRNPTFPPVLALLRDMGHEVHDFRDNGFSWHDIFPGVDKELVRPDLHRKFLEQIPTINAFNSDMKALASADVVVMVCPCGNSAHLEGGYAVGMGKKLIIMQRAPQRPDVMYKMGTLVTSPCALRAAVVDAAIELNQPKL